MTEADDFRWRCWLNDNSNVLGKSVIEAEADRLNQRLAGAISHVLQVGAVRYEGVALPDGRNLCVFRDGNDWDVGIDTNPNEPTAAVKPWYQCSLDEKALIAEYIAFLHDHIVGKAREQRERLASAHAALDQFAARIRSNRGGA